MGLAFAGKIGTELRGYAACAGFDENAAASEITVLFEEVRLAPF